MKHVVTVLLAIAVLIAACSDHASVVPTSASPETPDTLKEPPKPEDPPHQQPANFYEYTVLPQQTDSLIDDSVEPHYVYLDTRVSLRNKLLVFIGGTRSYPSYFQMFCKTAAALGYHVVNVNYPNAVSVRVCSTKEDFGCFEKFREEILFGVNESNYVQVDSTNCIQNRVLKLLRYLHQQHPGQHWDQYYDEALRYERFIIAGHSQGGGHAAYLALKFELHRVIVLSAPNDYSELYSGSAAWCRAEFKTPSSRFYGLNHRRDEIVSPHQQYKIWSDMNMLSTADTCSADGDNFKPSHALITNLDPDPEASFGRLKHNVPAMDVTFPGGSQGDQLKKAWQYLLE